MAYRRQQSLEVREVSRGAGFRTGAMVRTALAIEPRNGQLFVFMPPVTTADDYVELVTAIEDTAAALEMPVADRRLHAALRRPLAPDQSNTRPWRDRSQHPSRHQLDPTGRKHGDPL